MRRPIYTFGMKELTPQDKEPDRFAHVWIVDGYKTVKKSILADIKGRVKIDTLEWARYNFVHCNWGWGPDGNNGYCLSSMTDSHGNTIGRRISAKQVYDPENFSTMDTVLAAKNYNHTYIYLGTRPNK